MQKVTTMRFTRAMFGLVQSPFLLGATLEQHLSSFKQDHQELVEEVTRSESVDDIISGGETLETVIQMKKDLISMFNGGGFSLHKWHSNITG